MEIFYSQKLNESLKKEGYAIVDVLSPDEISSLEEYFNGMPDDIKKKHTTWATNHLQHKKEVDSLIKKIVHNKLKTVLTENMIPFWGNYMIKSPDAQNTNLPLHNDWQYVNEDKSISLNVWIPLTDTNIENGALHVIPTSHLYSHFPRGINLPRYYEKNEEKMKADFGKILNIKKGQAVIYDHRLLHYSYPNRSKKERTAITLIYVPRNTEIIHYHKDILKNQTYIFEIPNAEAFIEADYFAAPKQYSSKKSVELPEMDSIDLYALLKTAKSNSIFGKFFNYVKTKI